MPIHSMNLKRFGPFDGIDLRFDRRVNVFIGPNNCGKSTILMALAEAVVCPFSAPTRLYREGKHAELALKLYDGGMSIDAGLPCELTPPVVDVMKELGYTGFVPALRQNTGFRPKSPMGEGTTEPRLGRRTVRHVPVQSRVADRQLELSPVLLSSPAEMKLDVYTAEDGKERRFSQAQQKELDRRNWETDPSRMTDRTVVSKMVELDYRSYRKNDPRYRRIVEVAASICSEIMTGFSVRFLGIEDSRRGLYPAFKTPDGPLPLDTLSQGTQSVIQWVSHLVLGMAEYYEFPEDIDKKAAVFIIDEIDAHMHPSWQRRIIPTITRALPNCQLFVSTHSPLILSGLAQGQVQLLRRDENNKVTVSTNSEDTEGWSVDEIMRWLMGMKGTYDIGTETMASRLGELRSKKRLSKIERAELESVRDGIHKRLLATQDRPSETSKKARVDKTTRRRTD